MTRPGPRERLLTSALELTYTQGVGVGVDAILKHADVARRSLYQHFGGKDGLITEVIAAGAAEDEARYAHALDQGGNDPRERVRTLFTLLTGLVAAPGFTGCRYIAAHLNLPPGHPATAGIRAHKDRVRAMFARETHAMGHPAPEDAAARLLMLADAVLVEGALRPEADLAVLVEPMVEAVLG
ncbi:TetR family transcriptional regulator [Actinorhabdospora filicis]|uniref:TetR family transcriptional regulator n=1 Tax=Actinorhabdospora filicis TaxID=1785913 RepID=A0A9W6WCL2_9ACTN|nr:TetR/AcrR family transcriptional regulator [Actinorhabdospora filicis]GLZ80706.1 TetR family transcriptional regulator [Actinorhabdospora filicis]